MSFLGAIGRTVGMVPGMKTMNKALPGGGMPGVNQQPKPQLGGGLGPSIKSQMQPPGQMKQMMPPTSAPQGPPPMQSRPMPSWMQGGMNPGGVQNPNQSIPIQPPQNQGNTGVLGPMNSRPQWGGMGPSPMGMPPWMRGGYGGNTGFAGGMMKPHVMPNMQRNPNQAIFM